MATQLNLDISEELNITTKRGDSLSFTVTVKDSDGDPVDLTGYNFAMDVRLSNEKIDSNVVLSTSPPSAMAASTIVLVGYADGTLTLEATRQAMESVDAGGYMYDIQATNNSTLDSKTWFFGSFDINDDVSVWQ